MDDNTKDRVITYNKCDSPRDVCILVNNSAKKNIEKGKAREIYIDEALAILDKTRKAGLLHLTMYVPNQEIQAICSCCKCCCHDLRALLEYQQLNLIAKADFIAQTHLDLCNDCGHCVDFCMFHGREIIDYSFSFKDQDCYGCGLCIDHCPENAITLVTSKPA